MSPQIISASRRTDIPAFYTDWLLNRLAEGFCDVLHPYTKMMFRVSLKPEDVGAIVFWSKNYGPLLPKLDAVERTGQPLAAGVRDHGDGGHVRRGRDPAFHP